MSSLSASMSQPTYKNNPQPIHPHKFQLWLGMGSMMMIFAGLTSAFIVRRGQGDWTSFQIPSAFYVSLAIAILCSISLFIAVQKYKQQNYKPYRMLMGLSLILSLAFCVSQYIGWQQMQQIGILLQGNPSGSFVYVISGFHIAHVLGGVAFIAIFFLKSFKLSDPVQQLIASSKRNSSLGIELVATYWHFVDLLWIYLLLFFGMYL